MCYNNARLIKIQGFILILYSDFPELDGIIRHFKLYPCVNSAIKPEIPTRNAKYSEIAPAVYPLRIYQGPVTASRPRFEFIENKESLLLRGSQTEDPSQGAS